MRFEALVHEQTGPLERRLRGLLGDPHAAEDLCQEALARTWAKGPPTEASHPIRTGENNPLRGIVGRSAAVGGAHHQAVRRLGRGVRPTAVSPDGVVESIDVPGRRFALGVQWHPESPASPVAGPLLGEAYVEVAAAA